MKNEKICLRCIMDNSSDNTIVFDENGYCNYCNTAIENMPKVYFPNEDGERKLQNMIVRLKKENIDKKYDCLMGISGGLDSSYLAYLGATKWGLRILAVHIDDGFDEPIAVDNINKLCKACGIELITEKPDADQFNNLTRAFMLAGVPNLAIPQDNILFACLYRQARKNKLSTFLLGGNFSLECILQNDNTYDASDAVHIKDINRRFGRKSIDKLPLISAQRKIADRYFYKISTLRPLNYIDYNKEKAIKELEKYCGFKYYESKHLENTLTKFIQLYWFYNKFGVDKRKSHLSSMIISGQMTREEALVEIQKPLYDRNKMEKDICMILEKLELTRDEFDKIMSMPPKQHMNYKTSKFLWFCNWLSKKLREIK